MSDIPTVTVRDTFTSQSGAPLVGAQLVATLNRRELYHRIIVVPGRSAAVTDDDGVAELTLFPSRYHIALYGAAGDVVFCRACCIPGEWRAARAEIVSRHPVVIFQLTPGPLPVDIEPENPPEDADANSG